MTAWQKCGFVFQGATVFDPKVLYVRNAALPGGDGSRQQTRRNIINETVETVHKILEKPDMQPEEKLFFIHVVAGRAINSDVHEQGQRYAVKLKDDSKSRRLTPLEQKMVDGYIDTGAIMDEDYEREEEAVQKFEAKQLEGKKFACSVCKKPYVREAACLDHGYKKHTPSELFACIRLMSQEPEADGGFDLAGVGRNPRGRFQSAVDAGADVAPPPRESPRLAAAAASALSTSNAAAAASALSPSNAAAAAQRFPSRTKKIKCMICKGFYKPNEVGKHIKKKRHKKAVQAATAQQQ